MGVGRNAEAKNSAAVSLEDLTLGYDGHPAVHHVNGAVQSGALLAIVGPNGSGKSTLVKAMVGAVKPLGGRIVIAGGDRRKIAYLPQQMDVDRSFPITVFDFVSLGLWHVIGAWGRVDGKAKNDVHHAIAAVGLEGFERRTIDQLSGGQLQRILFARVLVQDSSLIVLDEPFTAIDAKTAADLMRLIEHWHGEKRTIVVVLHDLELVKERFPESILLAREVVAWGPSHDVLTPQNLITARAMSEAWDETALWCARRAA